MDTAITTIFLPLAALYFTNSLDMTDGTTVLAVRVAYALFVLIDVSLLIALRRAITARHDLTVFYYWPKAMLTKKGGKRRRAGAPPDPDDAVITTHFSYDLGEWRTLLMKHGAGIVGSCVFHALGPLSPLTVAAATSLPLLLDTPLVKVYLLRRPAVGKLARPFGEPENMWGAVTTQYQDLRKEMAK